MNIFDLDSAVVGDEYWCWKCEDEGGRMKDEGVVFGVALSCPRFAGDEALQVPASGLLQRVLPA
jgi:hypothetical protein